MEKPGKQALEPPRSSQHQCLEDRALRRLKSAFEEASWEVSDPSSGRRRPDLLCRKGERVYAVELKAWAGRARRAILPALLADAILQARAAAAEYGARPLAILAASSLSPEIAAELGEYVREFGGDAAWGAIDERGRFDLHGPGLESVRPLQGQSFEAQLVYESAAEAPVRNPFSDLGQWMLKVLLAPKVPEQWLHAPRRPVAGVADLAAQAGVSPASASKFLAALASGGHIAQGSRAVRLVRIDSLFESWRAASQRPAKEVLARFLLPSPEPARRLREVLASRVARQPDGSRARVGPAGERVCLALFSACQELDLGFVRGAPVHLYSENLSRAFLKSLELHPVEHRGEADLVVRRPHFPESVFRGCVQAKGVPVADVVQCWLDVSFHSARGAEQADEIAKRLRWSEWDR